MTRGFLYSIGSFRGRGGCTDELFFVYTVALGVGDYKSRFLQLNTTNGGRGARDLSMEVDFFGKGHGQDKRTEGFYPRATDPLLAESHQLTN